MTYFGLLKGKTVLGVVKEWLMDDDGHGQVDVVSTAAPATLPLPTGAATESTLAAMNGKLGALSRTPRSGQQTVAAAGTEVALGASQVYREVTVIANSDNTGNIYIGNDGTDHVSSTTGGKLPAGGFATFHNVDISKIFVDVAVSGEGVSWFGEI